MMSVCFFATLLLMCTLAKDLSVEFTSALVNLTSHLNKNGYEWALHAGTLLHFHRDGKILPDANDVDITMPLEYFTDDFVQELKQVGFQVVRKFRNPGEVGHEIRVSPVQDGQLRTDIGIDIFSTEQNGDGTVNTFLVVSHRLWKCGPLPYYPLQQSSFGENTFTVPSDVETYLSVLYGNWKERVPSKRWAWQNERCQLDERFGKIPKKDVVLLA